jgi:hypothetical protein
MRSWITMAVAGALLLSSATAEAAFPGANGRIVFTSDEAQQFPRRLLTINPDGSGRTKISDAGDDPAWSPDGTRIAYTEFESNVGYHIAIVNADGSGHFLPAGLTPFDTGPSWSPDGRRIAFAREAPELGGFGHDEIFVMGVDGSDQTRITDSQADGIGLSAREPAWSPDGTRIAFTRTITQPGYPGDAEIYVINTDGTGLTRLTDNPAGGAPSNDLSPSWSPDGTQIAFSSRRNGQYGVYVMNADGTGLRRLADAPAGSYPAWSPDGTRIVYGNHDIVTVRLDGSDLRNLTQTVGISELNPDWQRLNRPADCSNVHATPTSLWPPNKRLVTVTLDGATDPDGDEVAITATGVTQDEPVRRGPDAILRDDRVRLRADRNPRGDGRVYRIAFTVSDDRGGVCEGVAKVEVRRHRKRPAVDSAPPSYDSLHR